MGPGRRREENPGPCVCQALLLYQVRQKGKDMLVSQSIRLMKQRAPEIWTFPRNGMRREGKGTSPKGTYLAGKRFRTVLRD